MWLTGFTEFREQASAIPVVLLGDLNLTPWSPLFLELQSRSGLVRGISDFSLEPTWYRFPVVSIRSGY